MGGLSKVDKKAEEILSEQIRSRAEEVMGKSNLSEVLNLIGAKDNKEAAAALRMIMADKLSEFAIKSRRIAKKRGKMSPSAVIMAAAGESK
ncbi:MAG: hypothetical protein ACP5UH_00830 [Candidatus Micrarchaeia archaeon]